MSYLHNNSSPTIELVSSSYKVLGRKMYITYTSKPAPEPEPAPDHIPPLIPDKAKIL